MSDFSIPVDPATVQGRPRRFELRPDESQRKLIAERLDLIDLPAFSGEIELARERGSDVLRLTGHVEARVVQSCVVTLEPVESEIDYPFVERYSDDVEIGEDEIYIDADDESDIDLLPDELDVADIAIQHLSLALDPYPRSPEAEEQEAAGDPADQVPTGPFAKLAVLKGGKRD